MGTLLDLQKLGFDVQLQGQSVVVRPADKLDGQTRRLIRERKSELIAELESSYTWRLHFADSKQSLTHYVTVPATSRATVIERFKDQRLISCDVDQCCRSCGWRTGQALAGSPVWCSNPKRRGELKPVYGINHPAREIAIDNGSACTEFTSRP
jgi:hypothetical protein